MCLIPGQAPDLGFRRRRLIPCLNAQECGWKPVRGPETVSRSMRVRRRPSHIWKCGTCCQMIANEVTIPPAGGASAVVSWKLPARACQVNPGGWKIRLGEFAREIKDLRFDLIQGDVDVLGDRMPRRSFGPQRCPGPAQSEGLLTGLRWVRRFGTPVCPVRT